MIGAKDADELRQLVWREDHAIEIDFLEIAGWRMWQVGMGVRAGAPGMIDAAAVAGQITAAVYREYLQVGMPLQHAVENEIVESDRGLQRIADDIVEIEARQSFPIGEAVRMDDDERAKLLGFFPERRILRLGELASANIGQDFGAFHPE